MLLDNGWIDFRITSQLLVSSSLTYPREHGQRCLSSFRASPPALAVLPGFRYRITVQDASWPLLPIRCLLISFERRQRRCLQIVDLFEPFNAGVGSKLLSILRETRRGKELAALAAKLGVSVEHLWGVLVRQASTA